MMLGSPVLGVAVGLIILFVSTSLLCSGITESVSNLFQMRAKYLLTGLRAMLDGPATNDATSKVANKQLHEAVKDSQATRNAADELTARRTADAAPAPVGRGSPARVATVPADPDATLPVNLADAVAARAAAPPTPRPGPAPTPRPAAPPSPAPTPRRAAPPSPAPTPRPAAPPSPAASAPPAAPANPGTPTSGTPAGPTADLAVVTTALFASPLLTSLQSRRVWPFREGTIRNPQYVSGQTFTLALVDLLVPSQPDGSPPIAVTIDALAKAVATLPSPTLRRQLNAFLASTGQDVGTFEESLEHWYDEQMAKISGWYKRWARVALGITGLAVAILFNLDALQVAHNLYVDVPLQQAVLATADTGTLCQNVPDPTTCVTSQLADLKAAALPIGWPDPGLDTVGAVVVKIVGWGLTAFAVSFGAPFWFEALSRLGSLRNTGTRPEDRPGG